MKNKHLIAIAIVASIISWQTNLQVSVIVPFSIAFLAGIFCTLMETDDIETSNRAAIEHNKSWLHKKEIKSVSLINVTGISLIVSVILLAIGLAFKSSTVELFIFLGCISGSTASFYCGKKGIYSKTNVPCKIN